MSTVSQPDDNMIPGQTYTFQLDMTGFHFPPSASAVQTALVNWAPSFVGNPQVTSPFTTTLYNCQFTYTGDGSDVISDVGKTLTDAVQSGIGIPMDFKGAVADTAASITVNPSTAGAKMGNMLGDAVQTAVDKITSATAKGAQNLLTPVEIAIGIVAIILIALIFTAGKSGGVEGGPGGFKLGGK